MIVLVLPRRSGNPAEKIFEGIFENWGIISVVILDINSLIMKKLKMLAALALTGSFLVLPFVGLAGDTNSVASAKAKPDLLTTCPVSGDKLGEMGKPVVFVYQGQEVKLCCPDCKKDFNKDPAKYISKIRAADKEAKN
jgi:YHS domain-containing protein